MIRTLAWVACLLTLCITGSSAFIRHSKAGVGCDDWPACYQQASSARVAVATPAVGAARALHRVSAMAVGVLVLFLTVFGWSTMRAGTRVAVAIALADTMFLAWLGRLTPHELPLVTIGNLIGGLALAASLAWIAVARPLAGGPATTRAAIANAHDDEHRARLVVEPRCAAPMAWLALALLAMSAWTGTMIGAHGVIDACAQPVCFEGARFDAAALDPMQPATTLEAGSARGLHAIHRSTAAAFAVSAMLIAWRMRRRGAIAVALVAATLMQWLLGAGTAMGTLPLFTTTAHNVVAALLVVMLAGIAALDTRTSPLRSRWVPA